MEAWWNTQNPEEVYYIATFDWSGIGVDMPFATNVYGYYNDFGNGYVPFFGVIGAYNILMYGDNYQTGAVAAVPDAIASFSGINVVSPIADIELVYNETTTIDVSDVFQHAEGVDFTVIVDNVANPSVCDVTIDGDILTVVAGNTMNSTEVTLRAIANDGENGTDTFIVDVSDPSLEIIFSEDFSGGDIPDGWEMTTNSAQGWWITTDGSSYYWTVPAGDGMYACSNDDMANDDGSVDYLITPSIDFSAVNGAILSFDSYYTAAYSQIAHVKIRENGGAWTELLTLDANTNWTNVEIALGDYAGVSDIQILFHSDDSGIWASGWAIDNVEIEASGGSEDPIIDVSVSEIIQVGPGVQTFEISNIGAAGTVLSYEITSEYVEPVFENNQTDDRISHMVYAEVLCYAEERDEDWLTIDPISGDCDFGESDEINLTFNDAFMDAGDYFAEIMIVSNGGDVVIPVTFTVEDNVHPTLVTFQAWVVGREDEILTQDSGNCDWNIQFENHVSVQCESFPTPWAIGETLHLIVEETTTGYQGEAEIVLTEEPYDLMDPIMVGPVDANNNVIIPDVAALNNCPNPFNRSTTINFSLSEDVNVGTIEIFNIKGQLVKEFSINNDDTSVNWDASNQASGIYFYKMKAGGRYTSTKKMILLK